MRIPRIQNTFQIPSDLTKVAFANECSVFPGCLDMRGRISTSSTLLYWRREETMGTIGIDVDTLSNQALDAIEGRKYDQAEKLCQQLLREHPGAFDGHDRMGELREIQGRFDEAAEHYSKMLTMVKSNLAGTGADTLKYCTEKRDRALAKAKRGIDVPQEQLDEALSKAKAVLPAETFKVLEKIVCSYSTVRDALKSKDTTMERLRRMLSRPSNERGR